MSQAEVDPQSDFPHGFPQSTDIELYDFPADEDTAQMLYWMGDDYVAYLVDGLQDGFRGQDPGTELIALKCEERPHFLTSGRQDTGAITAMTVTFRLQALLKDSAGSHWRLFLTARYRAENLDNPKACAVTASVDVA